MATPNPRPTRSLDNTLEGLNLSPGQIDPTFLSLAQNLQAPEQLPIPQEPGAIAKIFGSLGAGLSAGGGGNSGIFGQMLAQTRQQAQQAELQNRQLQRQHEATQIELITAGVREQRRQAERDEDLRLQSEFKKREQDLKESQIGIAAARQRLAEKQFDFEIADAVGGAMQRLTRDGAAVQEQFDAYLAEARDAAQAGKPLPEFAIQLPPTQDNPEGILITDPQTFVTEFEQNRANLLRPFGEDPDEAKQLNGEFQTIFDRFIGSRILELNRIVDREARQGAAQARAKKARVQATTEEGKQAEPAGGVGGAKVSSGIRRLSRSRGGGGGGF